MEFYVGQKVWLRPLHIRRDMKNAVPVEGEVVKIGRKYIYVCAGFEYKFEIGEYSHDVQEYSPDYALHSTRQGVYDYWEIKKLIHEYSSRLAMVARDTHLNNDEAIHEALVDLRKVGEVFDKLCGGVRNDSR